jgi:hypothetical protein
MTTITKTLSAVALVTAALVCATPALATSGSQDQQTERERRAADAAGQARSLRTFSVAVEFGEEIEVLSRGPLTVTAACRHDPNRDVAELVFSSATDWQLTGQAAPLSAADERVGLSGNWLPGTTFAYGAPAPIPGQVAGVTAMAATGALIILPADTVAFGTDGVRCTVTGAALLTLCAACVD